MTEQTLLEVLGDLVDGLDVLNAHVENIANTLSLVTQLEDVVSGECSVHIRIVNESDDPLNVELMPVDD